MVRMDPCGVRHCTELKCVKPSETWEGRELKGRGSRPESVELGREGRHRMQLVHVLYVPHPIGAKATAQRHGLGLELRCIDGMNDERRRGPTYRKLMMVLDPLGASGVEWSGEL